MHAEANDGGSWNAVLRALSRRLGAAQQRLRARVSARVDEIIRVTEVSALASGEAIGVVNERAREQCALFQRVVDAFDEERRRSVEIVQRQRDLGGEAVRCLERQLDCVDHSMNLTGQIGELAENIGKIALGARILTLNGQVEAARLGEAGRPFAVIVDQLRELSARVEAANQTISRLAHDLTEAMPSIAQSSQVLLGITAQIVNIKGQDTAAQSNMASLLRQSQETSEDISLRTLQVLEHLQSQDWLSQRLRALEPLNERFGKSLESLFERITEEDICTPEAVLAALERPAQRGDSAAPAAAAEATMQPGEIVMF